MYRGARLTLPQMRERARNQAKRWQNAALGRVCKYCGAPDTVRAFSGTRLCGRCKGQLQRTGGRICQAPNCKMPAGQRPVRYEVTFTVAEGFKIGEDIYLCRKHNFKVDDIPVTLLSRGRTDVIPVKRSTKIRLTTGATKQAWELLKENGLSLVVRMADFWSYKVTRPVAILGIDPVPTRDTAFTLLEFFHSPGVDDETGNKVLSPEWFERRFGQGKHLKTWKRSFERTKQRFRALGLDPTNIDMQKCSMVLKLGEAAWFGET